MIRRALFASLLLFTLFAAVAVAQSSPVADVGVEIDPVSTTDGTRDISWTIEVYNNGPGDARNVVVTASTEPPLDTTCSQTTIDIVANSRQAIACTTKALGKTGDVLLHAHVAYDNDLRPESNDYTRGVHVIAGADTGIFVITPVIDPGLPFELGLVLQNAGAIPATGVTVTIPLPPHTQVASLPGNCTQSGALVTCSAPDIPPATFYNGHADFSISLIADDSTNGQTIPISADIHTTAPEDNLTNNHYAINARVFRTFFVTQATGFKVK